MKGSAATASLLILFCTLSIFLRTPTVTSAFFDPDIAGVAYSAQDLYSGGCIYKNTVETKPPLSYFLFALMFLIKKDMLVVHKFAMLIWCGLIVALYLFASSLFDRTVGILAAFALAINSADIFSDALSCNFETWTLLPIVLAYLFSYKFVKSKDKSWMFALLAGLFSAIAIMGKQQAAIILVGAILFALLFGFRNFLKFLVFYIIGAIMVILPAVVFFTTKGCLEEFLNIFSPLRAKGYIVSYGSNYFAWSRLWWQLNNFWGNKPVLFLTVLASPVLFFVRAYQKSARAMACIFAILSALAVLSTGKFFSHYFVYMMPVVSIILPSLVLSFKRTGLVRAFLIGLLIVIPTISSFKEIGLAAIATDGLVQEESTYTSELEKNLTKFGPFYKKAPDWLYYVQMQPYLVEAGAWIKNNSGPSDKILVWPYLPQIYFFADRRSPTRHFMSFDVIAGSPHKDYGGWHVGVDEHVLRNRMKMMEALYKDRPTFIVLYSRECPPADASVDASPRSDWPKTIFDNPMVWCDPQILMFDELEKFVTENYEPAFSVDNARIAVWQLKKSP